MQGLRHQASVSVIVFAIKPRRLPDRPDYAAVCKQTVTLYNKAPGANVFYKTVFTASAYLESKKVSQEARTGITASNSVLLVIPLGASGYTFVDPIIFDALEDKTGYFTLRNGDKAVPGVGADMITVTEWAHLIPGKVPGVVVIKDVDVKRNLTGEIVHIEGGG